MITMITVKLGMAPVKFGMAPIDEGGKPCPCDPSCCFIPFFSAFWENKELDLDDLVDKKKYTLVSLLRFQECLWNLILNRS